MKVVFTAAARRDLEAVADFIAADDAASALAFVAELREACEGLATLMRRFPLVPRYAALGIRRRVHGNYLIFYRIRGDTVEILHVLHGAMDYERVLFPSPPGG